ncbi:hypothetical protein [Corynebacterium ulceribovis]|uniref:hypothetical protein n=1 Tax=Corynebacterium ulceribovis TaxID=487732 RepID=UPI00036DFB4E|nr:hypothetical protein [Corynebacterium ulceribovis]
MRKTNPNEQLTPQRHAAIREALDCRYRDAGRAPNGRPGNRKVVSVSPGEATAIVEVLHPDQYAQLEIEHPRLLIADVSQAMKRAGILRPGKYWVAADRQGRIVLQEEETLPVQFVRNYHRARRKRWRYALLQRLGLKQKQPNGEHRW